MTDTPRSNEISPVVFMGSGGPDLTAPEAVERLAQMLETDASDQHTQPCEMTGLMPEDEYEISATLRALSAQLLDVSKREAAMIARYDAKLEAAEARVEKAEAERDELKAHNRYWSGEYDVVLAGRADEHDRAEALDAKLKEAVGVMDSLNNLTADQAAKICAFLASLEGDKP